VLPEFGTVEDFVVLLDEAHKRGIRVITDLVMNHTSDTHPWFEESRRNPEGPYGDYYVWSDDDSRYADARIIFVDTETSNWTYDPVRGQFYWHRFFSHQPDLNYDNPAVQEAMLEVLRFWLDLGIDGFRLDAVPYLFEREGTNCENLAESHAFLKRCRKVMDDEYPGRVLLAEANQWPSDVVEYFGEAEVGGDECHMAFHFPLMPRHLPAQPRRADARDGHRRRARLHVRGVRQGPADEGQHRHPPPARPAAGERPQPARTVHRAALVPARFTRSVLR
jgi:maltose alpha-D-glucosyltransferase/alpha-amylase